MLRTVARSSYLPMQSKNHHSRAAFITTFYSIRSLDGLGGYSFFRATKVLNRLSNATRKINQ